MRPIVSLAFALSPLTNEFLIIATRRTPTERREKPRCPIPAARFPIFVIPNGFVDSRSLRVRARV